MKKLVALMLCSGSAFAGFAEGVPVLVQKSDYADKNLVFIKLDKPIVATTECDNLGGVVVHDSNASSQAALSFAMTALVSGKKFRCYIRANECSTITGDKTTYPVCSYYPSLVN